MAQQRYVFGDGECDWTAVKCGSAIKCNGCRQCLYIHILVSITVLLCTF